MPLRQRLASALGAAILAAGLTSIAWYNFKPSTPLTVTRFRFTLPEGNQIGSIGRQVAISPDDMQMVYVANQRLYLRSMSELEARPIPGTEISSGPFNPVFSPDGQSIAFNSITDRTLRKISVSGGAAVTICQADALYGMSWGVDGILFGQGAKGIMRVSPNGGTPELLVSVKGDELAHVSEMLPDGQTVLFALATGTAADRWDKAKIVAQSLTSGERKTLIEGGSDAHYLPTGHLVYALGGTLFALPFDVGRLEVTGGPVPILEGVRRGATNTGSAHLSFANTGSLVYVPGPVGTSSSQALVLTDRKGGGVESGYRNTVPNRSSTGRGGSSASA